MSTTPDTTPDTPTTPTLAARVRTTAVRCLALIGAATLLWLAPSCDPHAPQTTYSAPLTHQVAPVEPAEDDPAFDCRIHGNQVCGPNATVEPGCYVDGELTVPWRDDMYGRGAAACSPVIGVYEVPGGELTVFADTSARYQPSQV